MQTIKSIEERLREVEDAIEFVRGCSTQDRKLSGEKTVNGHYVKAMQELDMAKKQIQNQLERMTAKVG